MSYLTLNELVLDPAIKGRSFGYQTLGQQARDQDGGLMGTQTAIKRFWRFRTVPIVQSEANGWIALLGGDTSLKARHWSYDADLFDDGKGLNISAGSTAGAGTTPGQKFGAGYLRLSIAEQITYPTALTDEWTFMHYLEDGAGGWDHYVIDSDGTEWKNGATISGGTITWVSIDGSGNIILGDGAGAFKIDDVVVIPAIVPPLWITGTWQSRAAAFSDFPHLLASGDVMDGKIVEVKPRILSISPSEFIDGGVFQTTSQVISFTLDEV